MINLIRSPGVFWVRALHVLVERLNVGDKQWICLKTNMFSNMSDKNTCFEAKFYGNPFIA